MNTRKPDAMIGVGLRHLHYQDALEHDNKQLPIDFVEVHAENFFAKGGITRALLNDVRERYPLSIHGTSLGLGSEVDVPEKVLNAFADLVNTSEPMLVSEHLCFNRAKVEGQVLHSGDLLPIAYNKKSLAQIGANILQVQDAIKRPILIENLSAYVSANALDASAKDTMTEFEFLINMCEQNGCKLLLDLNNLIVNALNQNAHETNSKSRLSQDDLLNALSERLTQLPPSLVGEIHLAGFSEQQVSGFIVDDHGQAVSQQCWDLYKRALQHFGNVATLIEWDSNLPPWSVLTEQARIARQCCNAL
uniref:DUF692 domain-containing protein n=1 Tax=Ningiella ruwaisensis TaxID=2364274 RepID=UPI00109FC5AB|nr:DUF692 domain-containing protein [Ningiella ruwaisensis]